MLLGYNFEPRPNGSAIGTAGSVLTIGLPINRCSHSKAQTFGLLDFWTSKP